MDNNKQIWALNSAKFPRTRELWKMYNSIKRDKKTKITFYGKKIRKYIEKIKINKPDIFPKYPYTLNRKVKIVVCRNKIPHKYFWSMKRNFE